MNINLTFSRKQAVTPLNTAVLFLIFNRLDTTKIVLDSIKEARPPRIYIAADGPRDFVDGESEKVNIVRDFVVNNIDWECEVKTMFRQGNLGCKLAVSGAIDWFFENEEMGIILEDDCFPSQSFFTYCEELLIKYKEQPEVSIISGDGRGTSVVDIENDYSFIKYPMIWGWASWRRVWEKYDVNISSWPQKKKSILKEVSNNRETKRYWRESLDSVYNHKMDTWDYQLAYLLFMTKTKCIVPKINLIKNVGFGEGATHTKDINDKNAAIENYEFYLPLSHAIDLENSKDLEMYYDLNEFYSKNSIFNRIINKVHGTLKKIF